MHVLVQGNGDKFRIYADGEKAPRIILYINCKR
jgi:hypothetical protein